jgi:hypothetical protein
MPKLGLRGERSLYADLISVTQSQLRYGKATSPSVIKRPSVWKYTRNLAGFVPTVEMLQRKGRGYRYA